MVVKLLDVEALTALRHAAGADALVVLEANGVLERERGALLGPSLPRRLAARGLRADEAVRELLVRNADGEDCVLVSACANVLGARSRNVLSLLVSQLKLLL
jgi:hypothetical protein